MTPEEASGKREQMICDGFCVIDNVLSDQFVNELIAESDRLNDTKEHHPDTRYQGTHLGIIYEGNSIMRKLRDWFPAVQTLEKLGFGDFVTGAGLLILTKEPFAPALYWHQDWTRWNDPLSCSPWPQTIFVSYYLEDTTIENGCLKVIPGTHRRRISLHDQLVPAHEQGARFIKEDHPIMFSDHPKQVEVSVKARSLVLADARLLHSAYCNQTSRRRNLLLLWHSRPDTIPENWNGDVPEGIRNRDPDADYPRSRIPGKLLR